MDVTSPGSGASCEAPGDGLSDHHDLLSLRVNARDVPDAGGELDDAAWRRALMRFVAFIPHTSRLGVSVQAVKAPAVRMQLPWRAELIGDPHRHLVHGGVLTMFADTLCGSAVLTALPRPEVCPTLDLRLDHFRPGVEGLALIGEARVVRVSEAMVFTEAQIWQQPGKILCRAIGNFVRLGARNTPEVFTQALMAAARESESSEAGASHEVAGQEAASEAATHGAGLSGLSDIRAFVEGQRTHAQLAMLLDSLPYARAIGLGLCTLEGAVDGEHVTLPDAPLRYEMTAMPENIGNPMLPAVHGGVLAAAMETAGTLEVLRRHGHGGHQARLPKLIDFSIDYLAAARGDSVTWIECEVLREGRRMANVRVTAWQKSLERPCASARMHFVLQAMSAD